MANVPVLNESGVQIGTIPNRSSKNPVMGVIRCDCGEPATVHNPRGKRSGRYYTMCNECGTDQRAGDTRQSKIRAEMVRTIEELPPLVNPVKAEAPKPAEAVEAVTEAEKTEPAKPLQANENAVSTVNEPDPKPEPNEPEPEPNEKPISLFAVVGALLGAALAVAL
jgi:hypothetical protein